MLIVVFASLALLFAYKIIFSKIDVDKLSWYFAGILFFPHSISLLKSPIVTFPRFIILITFISIILTFQRRKKVFNSFPLTKSLVLVFILLLLIGLLDSRINLFLKFYRPTMYFVSNFLIIMVPFFLLSSLRDVRIIVRRILLFFLIFGMYGLFNYVFKVNPFHAAISMAYGSVDYASQNMGGIEGGRFRISSFAWQPIYYGLLMSINILLLLFIGIVFDRSKLRFNYYYLFLIIACVNLLLVNSRTPILSLMVSALLMYLFFFNTYQKIKLVGIGAVVVFLLFLVFPKSLDIVNESLGVVFGQNTELKEASSSIEMRESQLAASVLLFSKSPLFGNGFSYIVEDLGYSGDKEDRTSDQEFYGFESYGYLLLIEQGICGMLANLIFFGNLFIFFIKRVMNKSSELITKVSFFSIAILLGYLLFIFGTGELQSLPVVISFVGILLRLVFLEGKKVMKSRRDGVVLDVCKK